MVSIPSNSINNTSHIKEGVEFLTVINMLQPPEDRQQETVNLLKAGITEKIRHIPGFISANIHRSLDSNHIIVYAQWESEAHLQEAVKLIETGEAPEMLEVFSFANPEYHPYQVEAVLRPIA